MSLALSSAEMGAWDWDVPAASMWWDDRMHALFGLAPGTFKGGFNDFLELVHKEDRQKIRAEFEREIATRTAVDTEFRVTWPSDASEHLVRMRSKVYGADNAECPPSRRGGLGHYR